LSRTRPISPVGSGTRSSRRPIESDWVRSGKAPAPARSAPDGGRSRGSKACLPQGIGTVGSVIGFVVVPCPYRQPRAPRASLGSFRKPGTPRPDRLSVAKRWGRVEPGYAVEQGGHCQDWVRSGNRGGGASGSFGEPRRPGAGDVSGTQELETGIGFVRGNRRTARPGRYPRPRAPRAPLGSFRRMMREGSPGPVPGISCRAGLGSFGEIPARDDERRVGQPDCQGAEGAIRRHHHRPRRAGRPRDRERVGRAVSSPGSRWGQSFSGAPGTCGGF
jgi:hypothetical protein